MTNTYMRGLTPEDVSHWGGELIDVSQRAALHAVAPHLQNLEQQNAELRQRLAKEARARLDQAIELVIPNYREIDRDPNWHRFLLTPDAYTGLPRQRLLNDAIQAGDAARVISFFKGFLREAGAADYATNRSVAGGAARRSPEKATYTRDQIGRLYEQHRKGFLTGPEWARIETDIFAAQREGRVQSHPYITK